MNSNLLSRILPPSSETQSIYEAIKQHDRVPQGLDYDAPSDSAIDHRNFEENFHDKDLDQLLAEAAESRITSESAAAPPFPAEQQQYSSAHAQPRGPAQPGTGPKQSGSEPSRLEDDAVPDSLLLEQKDTASPDSYKKPMGKPVPQRLPSPVPGPSTSQKRRRVQWDTPQIQQRLTTRTRPTTVTEDPRQLTALASANPVNRALWRWANVENLDNYLKDVYDYYVEKGFWAIMLSRAINSVTLAFIVGLGTFLTNCIDYSKLPGSRRMTDIKIDKCMGKMSGSASLLLWMFAFYWTFKLVEYVLDVRRLWNLHEFYTHLLQISDDELQTITWQAVVGRLMDLRDSNPRTALQLGVHNRRFIGEQSKQRMDAHDIANRLMRKENYLIALFNKDILDLTLPIPLLKNRKLFSKNLEWSINLCVIDYVFNDQGQVQQLFLKDSHRRELVEALQRRFLLVGFINVLCAPFIVTYFLMFFFLRYFKEFQRNPAELGARSYTPLAEWTFREFNELSHFFHLRLNMSDPFASHYIDQFPKEKTVQVARFIAFVAGALATVLAVASLLDPDVFLGFEITGDRTVLFYLGVLTTIWAVARGLVPEDNFVFDPEFAIKEVIKFTHYEPAWWKGRLHSEEVKKDFSTLYQMKVLIFCEEILSILLTPFVLWFSLPKCSERLVDFFREFTVHVDGLGYVCSFALFDFQKGGSQGVEERAFQSKKDASGLREEYYSTKDGKMLSSYYSFLDSYANNPKRRVAGTVVRRNFQPPPDFPGLSPTEVGRPRTTSTDSRHNVKNPVTGSRPASRAPAASPEPQDGLLSPSLLLDEHHQPSILRSQKRGTSTSRSRMSRGKRRSPPDGQGENDQEAPLMSVALDDDNNLADSWKATKAAAVSEESRHNGGQEAAAKDDAGVLGLLYQFQKAQTENRGGVNI